MDIYKETSAASDLKHGRVLIGLAATPLALADGNVLLTTFKASRGIMIQNLGDGPVYVGGENVTVGTGFRVLPNQVMTIPVDAPDLLYLISDDVGREVRWIMA